MIPKKIHYCWFGKNPLDEKALRCIDSWKHFFPDFEITQWNESNYDFHSNCFTEQAYADKKWAFVSDVARLEIIYRYGGIYFDTDVEVIRSFNDILKDSPEGFMGMDHQLYVNTGLGFGAEKGHPLLKSLLEEYTLIEYNKYRKNLSQIACPVLTNKYLSQNGLEPVDKVQIIKGIKIYPHDYFNPLDFLTGQVVKTENTHSIHWYSDSWNSEENRRVKLRLRRYRRFFGIKYGEIIFGISASLRKEGLFKYILSCNEKEKSE